MASLYYSVMGITVVYLLFCAQVVRVLPLFKIRRPLKRRRGQPVHLWIVLGSGGHTAEMLLLLRNLDTIGYNFRRYIISVGDAFSAEKALEFEKNLFDKASKGHKDYGAFDIKYVTRARKIHQSILTTPLSVALCAFDSIRLLMTFPSTKDAAKKWARPYPDLIVTNGPATATVVIFMSLLLRFLQLGGTSQSMRCIYVESWARVKKLSLSGKILAAIGACERLLVQWKALLAEGREFRGQLVA